MISFTAETVSYVEHGSVGLDEDRGLFGAGLLIEDGLHLLREADAFYEGVCGLIVLEAGGDVNQDLHRVQQVLVHLFVTLPSYQLLDYREEAFPGVVEHLGEKQVHFLLHFLILLLLC